MESPVCPRVPTANPAVETPGPAGVGPAEYSFLSPALSLSPRGSDRAPLCVVLSCPPARLPHPPFTWSG